MKAIKYYLELETNFVYPFGMIRGYVYPIIFILLGVSVTHTHTHTHTVRKWDHNLILVVESTCVQSNNIIISIFIKILYLKETHNLCFRRG